MPASALFEEPRKSWDVLIRADPQRVVRSLASANATAHRVGDLLFNVRLVLFQKHTRIIYKYYLGGTGTYTRPSGYQRAGQLFAG